MFPKKHLKKIKNEQMKVKVNQYLRIKNALEEETETNISGRRGHKLCMKRNRKSLKSLHKDILLYTIKKMSKEEKVKMMEIDETKKKTFH